jgi:hypothetical protein
MSPMTSNPKRVADTALSVGRAIKRLVVGKNFYEELRDRMTRLGHEAAKKHDRGDLEGALAGYRTTLELAQHISRTFGEWIGGWHNLRWAFWNVAWTEFALGHFDRRTRGAGRGRGLCPQVPRRGGIRRRRC